MKKEDKLLSVEDALLCDDLTNMSREILKAYKENKNGFLIELIADMLKNVFPNSLNMTDI